MRLTWKSVSSLIAVTGMLAAAVALPASADTATVGLTKWVKTADGYGYDPTKPVMYTSTSTEQIQIPTEYTPQERQFRSAWVATVSQLNVARPANEADFQAQYTRILDRFEQDDLNAMIFQVRPMQDAWYPSAINPWSTFLSGRQGTDPGYDPLAWMVEQTHARGMEYHAWLNPYRVTAGASMTSAATLAALGMTAAQASALTASEAATALGAAGLLASNNYAVQHPDQVLLYGGGLFLDPGHPEVRDHVVATVRELAENYDIDAIHLDDYFYPYRSTSTNYFGNAGEDRATFETFGLPAGYADTSAGVNEWRRDNVTALIRGIHDALEQHNTAAGTAVQFGVSPFGIWEHKSVDPRGSNTPSGSSSTYSNQVYADTRGWVKDELIDYIVPQIYWSFDQAAAPYGELARWWNDTVDGTSVRLYIGHANYKHLNNGDTDPSWTNPDEVPNQLLFNQTLSNVSGSIFFSYNDIIPGSTAGLTAGKLAAMEAKNASIERIFGDLWTSPTLTPADPRKTAAGLAAPTTVGMTDGVATWTDNSAGVTRAFAVYLDGVLQRVVYATGGPNYALALAGAGAVSVSSLDRAMNETARVSPAGVLPQQPEVVAPPTTESTTQPQAATTAPSGTLAATGSDALPALLAAAALFLAGGLVLLLSRRAYSARENSEARAT